VCAQCWGSISTLPRYQYGGTWKGAMDRLKPESDMRP
jgi:hypothetical protein